MSHVLPFAKYHGLGNDFVVADLRGSALAAAAQAEDVVRALCDRGFGVGADGVLAVLEPTSAGADARMRVLNADGSEAEMCGNGLRCVVKALLEVDASFAGRDALTIDTGAGPLSCTVSRDGAAITGVTVDMGRPRLVRGEIPMTGPATERCIEVPLTVGDDTLLYTAVSMGNPHAIAFVDVTGAALRALAERVGPTVEHHAWFPRRTNVEFVRVSSPTELELVVWERGCGITLACGTGACATAVAACLTGRATVDTEITVHLLGGPLTITVAPDYSTVFMRGPAAHIFDASADLDAVVAAARPR